MTRVLLVDDEPQLLQTLGISLRAHAYETVLAADGTAALAAAVTQAPDVVVLDLGLPDIDGIEVVRRLRQHTAAPVIVLSARVGSRDKVEALDAGADDYVTKPFGIDELLARLRAAVRRAGPAGHQEVVRTGSFTLDTAARRASRPDGTEVRLTPTEWGLLDALTRSPGRLVGQRELLQEVWGPKYDRETHYLRVYMAQLRRKLESDPARPRHLVTEPGMGYRFEP